jgi:hypothetical protein
MNNVSKSELNSGSYIFKNNNQKVLLENCTDTIFVFENNSNLYKLSSSLNIENNFIEKSYLFHKSTFDIDAITIPVKFRSSIGGIPNQLVTDINAAVFLGKRNDYFKVKYPLNLFGKRIRKIEHFGFSLGALIGFGNTTINTYYLRKIIPYEYQALVFTKGVSSIFAVNKYTIGIAFGFDDLVDNNNDEWIYHNKPWLGITLGLNLN